MNYIVSALIEIIYISPSVSVTLAPFDTYVIKLIFSIGIVGCGVQLGPLGTATTNRPFVPAPGDYDDGEIS
jgi:hypothetical protein